jgi:hypothetical protein
VCPSEVIPPNNLDLSMLSVTFHARPSKGMLESRQPIFPCNDGSFPAI